MHIKVTRGWTIRHLGLWFRISGLVLVRRLVLGPKVRKSEATACNSGAQFQQYAAHYLLTV